MSKAVYLNVSAPGHVIPTLGLVKALVEAGEEIIYFEVPRFQSEVEAFGASFQAYPHQAGYPGKPGVNQVALAPALAWSAQDYFPELLDLIRSHNPDYLIHDSLCLWGKLAARILDLPAICTIASAAFNHDSLYGCPMFQSYSEKMFADAKEDLELFEKITGKLDRDYQTGPITFLDSFTNPEGLNICFLPRELQPYVDCFDDTYKFVGPVDPARNQTYDFPMDRLEGNPVVLVSMGTLHDAGNKFYRDAINAFTGSKYTVVMILGRNMNPADLGEVPDNFILRMPGTVPQLKVLEKSSLFIMHAGGGAARESAWFGVPVISVPQTYEQELIANCIEQAGAGITMRMHEITEVTLKTNVLRVLTESSFAENMQRMSVATRKAGGAPKAVTEILAYVATRTKASLPN